MTAEEFNSYVDGIASFLKEQQHIVELYKRKGVETGLASVEVLTDDLMEPSKLTAATIQYMVFSSADKDAAQTQNHYESMQLIAAYLQGLLMSRDLIIEGSYIKASATLKQDYEIMVRLNEISLNRQKFKKVPNPQNGPDSLKRVYGYLNDIAHISRHDVLDNLLLFQREQKSGISPVKQLNKEYLIELFLVDSFIKLEVLRHVLILHSEMFGEDDIYKMGLAHYNAVLRCYQASKLVDATLGKDTKAIANE